MFTYTHTNYTFAPGAAGVGTITLTNPPTGLVIQNIKYIKNLTANVKIFDPLLSSTLFGTYSGNVLTLMTATTGQNAADVLEIVIEAGAVLAANNGTMSSGDGTITTGGTAQVLFAASTTRQGWSLQNTSSGDLYVNDLGTATTSSYKIAPGAEYNPPAISTGAISILGATTGQSFVARQWLIPNTANSTLFVQGATPAGQQSAANSHSIVPATNYTESVSKEWKVVTATGTPTPAVGDILIQTIKNNAGTVSTTWFNMTSSVLMTVAPTMSGLFDLAKGYNNCNREEFALWTPGATAQTINGQSLQGAVYSVRQGTNAILTSQAGFTVPAGKVLRINSIVMKAFQNSPITFNNDGCIDFSVVYDFGTTPTANSAQGISVSGRWMWIPPTTNANNSATQGHHSHPDGTFELPAGAQIRILHHGINWNGVTHTLMVKGYLYNA